MLGTGTKADGDDTVGEGVPPSRMVGYAVVGTGDDGLSRDGTPPPGTPLGDMLDSPDDGEVSSNDGELDGEGVTCTASTGTSTGTVFDTNPTGACVFP